MKTIDIEIDIAAISVNSYQRNATTNRRYTTPKGKEWAEYIQWHLKSANIKPFSEETRLKVEYTFGFKSKRKRDVDNYIKPLQDTLEGFLFQNDEQIDELTAKKFYSQPHDYITIKLYAC